MGDGSRPGLQAGGLLAGSAVPVAQLASTRRAQLFQQEKVSRGSSSPGPANTSAQLPGVHRDTVLFFSAFKYFSSLTVCKVPHIP